MRLSEDSGRATLQIKPRGRGGVAVVAHRQARVLTRCRPVRLVSVGRGPRGQKRQLVRDLVAFFGELEDQPIVHLHTSLRSRAVVRDLTLYDLARRRQCPVVVQIHGWERSWMRRGAPPLVRRLVSRTLLRADRVLVVDPGLIEPLRRWGADPTWIANPFEPSEGPTAREPTGDEILYLGRFVAGKGLERLGDAFHEVVRQRPCARLVMAGKGPLAPMLQRRFVERGLADRVTWAGWIEGVEKARRFATASALVLPSDEEAAPLAVIEALAAGVPVVARATGMVRDLVGSAGVVVESRRPAALAEGLLEALAHPEWGEKGPAQVAAHRPSAVLESLEAIYRGCELAGVA